MLRIVHNGAGAREGLRPLSFVVVALADRDAMEGRLSAALRPRQREEIRAVGHPFSP